MSPEGARRRPQGATPPAQPAEPPAGPPPAGARRTPGPSPARAPARPSVLVITGDGLNCELETARAFELAGGAPELVHISDILEGVRRLEEFQILALVGGFSNGDHLGAGTVQASRFRHRLREQLAWFVAQRRPVIGICNGFQTLVKMGILPDMREPGAEGAGAAAWMRSATIMANDSGHFEDRWVHLLVDAASPCVWTRGLERLFLPVRHGEGRFFAREPGLPRRLLERNQVPLRYCDPQGCPTAEYPWNPNGSLEAVAGLCNASGTILGLMPHPEAFLSPYNHPSWTRQAAAGRPLPEEGQGVALFRNAVRFVRERLPAAAPGVSP